MTAIGSSLAAIPAGERTILGGEAADWARSLSTPQLLTEIESNRWTLGELDLRPESFQFVEESRAWLVWRLRCLNEELALRRRIKAANPDGTPPIGRPPAELKAELAEIKARIDLAGYVETFGRVRLERRGTTLWSCCPLPGHDDETPSFHVDPEQQLWHCFGCHRGGDLFAFAQAIHQEGQFWVLLPALRALAGLPQPDAPKTAKPVNHAGVASASPARPRRKDERPPAYEFRNGRLVIRS